MYRFFALSLILGLGSFFVLNTTTAEDKKSSIVAIVNGVDISEEQFSAVMNVAKSGGDSAQIDPQQVLDDLILTELARQEALKSGIENREDIIEKIAAYKNKVVLNTWMKEKAEAMDLNDETLMTYYEEQKSAAPKAEYKARHILLKTEQDAKEVITELSQNKDFAELAKTKSTGPTASQGGDLGWFPPEAMVPEFAQAITSLTPGSVSKIPVKTQFGWHVIKLEQKREVQFPPFEALKPNLTRQLTRTKMRDFLSGLKEKAKIKTLVDAERLDSLVQN